MANNINNNQNNNQNNMQNNNEINNLKNELSKANKIIEQQKSIINDLQNKLNNYNTTINNYQTQINNLKDIIIQKDLELNNLRNQLNNNNFNNANNRSNKVNVDYDELMSINFISTDQNLHFSIPCIKSDIFAHIEEKLYKEYPQYKETNNNFIANGKTILRFKTIAENNLVNERPVTLVVPS